MKEIMKNNALVFNIQHYSLHDGPGIRTVVFFKGCPMHCLWCSNPESQRFEPEISYVRDRCIGHDACGHCAKLCPEGITFGADGKAQIDFAHCRGRQDCAGVCPAGAIKAEGKTYTTDEILDIVEKDQVFYARSKGGLTVSGGEPLAQPQALIDLLKAARSRYIHTAIETCGMGDYAALKEAASYLNFMYYDVKSMDSKKHAAFTGHGNERILDNIRCLCAENTKTEKVIRTPVIPGFNDTEADLMAIREFVHSLPGRPRHELLPYHRYGEGKYAALGRPYEMGKAQLTQEIKDRIGKMNGQMHLRFP